IASDRNLIDARFPVQYVIRPASQAWPDYRGYAGTVAGGIFKPGDDVVVLPSGLPTKVASIQTADGAIAEAFPPMAVTMRLADDLDVSRGDMIARPQNAPHATQDVEAMLCWLDDAPLRSGGMYSIQHTTRTVRARLSELSYRLDINTLHRDGSATQLTRNEIGRVRLRTTSPLLVDPYRRNRTTGSFIVIDEASNRTAAAGMILDPL
ncbi:MAG: elongation factor 1-alpha C-terminal domain-related protein, partial [Mycobacteriales bacterium]